MFTSEEIADVANNLGYSAFFLEVLAKEGSIEGVTDPIFHGILLRKEAMLGKWTYTRGKDAKRNTVYLFWIDGQYHIEF